MFNSDIPKFGTLKVRVGPEDSGKTCRVVDNISASSRLKKGPLKKFMRILFVRPEKAKFEHPYIIESNLDKINIFEYGYKEEYNVDVCVLDYSSEDSLFIRYPYYDMYFIDDGHLYSEKIALAIARLVHQGKNVYFVGRNHDSKGKIYPTTLAVMLMSEVNDYKVLYNPWKPRIAEPEFKVVVGPMFATKTIKVVKKARNTKVIATFINGKLTISPANILILRPETDARFDDKNVFTTHTGNSFNFSEPQWEHINVAVVPYGKEQELLDTEANLIIVDECQFFSTEIATVLTELVKSGKNVYSTGLLHDFKGNVFTTSEAVMKSSAVTSIRKLWSQCGRCHEEGAMLSARIDENDKIVSEGTQVMVGDDEPNEEKMRYIAIHHRCKMMELGEI